MNVFSYFYLLNEKAFMDEVEAVSNSQTVQNI